jgi:adenosylhomocysteine nucleosidase
MPAIEALPANSVLKRSTLRDNAPFERSPVDKQLDIHSTRCAEAAFLPDLQDLSHNLPSGIPTFYSHCQPRQVLDPVCKKRLIHKKVSVYYYYQVIYIQVNLKKKSGEKMRLGIISALHEEQQGLVQAMQNATTTVHGGRVYTHGQLWESDAVCVLSRIGKVAGAVTATLLVEKFGVTHILFTGVAGAGDPGVAVGDIVVADALVQHDMDASPLFPRFEIPLTGLSHFPGDHAMAMQLLTAAHGFLEQDFAEVIDAGQRMKFRLQQPRVHRGLIASGDQFMHDRTVINTLNAALPGLVAVEMEGAAVAQVCYELGIPCAVIRTISDNANEDAATDFLTFVSAVAARYAFYIVRRYCRGLASNSF